MWVDIALAPIVEEDLGACFDLIGDGGVLCLCDYYAEGLRTAVDGLRSEAAHLHWLGAVAGIAITRVSLFWSGGTTLRGTVLLAARGTVAALLQDGTPLQKNMFGSSAVAKGLISGLPSIAPEDRSHNSNHPTRDIMLQGKMRPHSM
jgi:hypothetical protein